MRLVCRAELCRGFVRAGARELICMVYVTTNALLYSSSGSTDVPTLFMDLQSVCWGSARQSGQGAGEQEVSR